MCPIKCGQEPWFWQLLLEEQTYEWQKDMFEGGILADFMGRYAFNPELFPEEIEEAEII